MTRRERLEARAERRREWADKAKAAASAALHDVAAAIAGWVTETDGFAEWRARDDWVPMEASIIERIGMALANLDLRQDARRRRQVGG